MNIDRIAPLAIGLLLVLAIVGILGHAAHSLQDRVDSRLEQVQR